MNRPATSYDQVPYASLPFPQTHPDRLATLARLLGTTAPDPARCRVLELGCAAGGNLIPMAVALPEARFTGVDLSGVQIAEGSRTVEALGLGNVRLLQRSITEVDEGFGSFDYILCHGVYSWVPDAVQESILDICSNRLAPDGIAYVSYNTLPGWRLRGMIRDLMRYHAMQFDEPTARVAQARAILDFLAQSVPTDNAYGMLLKSELEGLRHQPDHYIFHEHLEEVNEPLYFHEFMARADRHGLQYLAEAEFGTMLASGFAPAVADTVRRIAPDLIRQEQFLDFLRNRSFRQTLLVHKDIALDRAITPQRVYPLWVSSPARPASQTPDIRSEAVEVFQTPGGAAVQTPNPVTKAAMVVLARRWPAARPFADLLAEARAAIGRQGPEEQSADAELLASDLLHCYVAGVTELHAMASPFAAVPGKRPLASALARRQVRDGVPVSNLRHEIATLNPLMRLLLPLLDGTRTRADLAKALARGAPPDASTLGYGLGPRPTALIWERVTGDALDDLARAALLIREIS